MTTTADTDSHRYLMALFGPEELANLSGPLTTEQEALIADFLDRHPVEQPLHDLVDAALNLDGSTRDEATYARLLEVTR